MIQRWMIIALAALSALAASGPAPSTLKEAFRNHFRIGAALNERQILGKDTAATRIVVRQFNTVTAENAMKWEHIHPTPGRFEFGMADSFVAFGERNGMFIVGHTLLWHNQTPRWVFYHDNGELLSRDALLQRLKEHITTVVGRYRGKVKGWDVVNEALEEDGSLRQSLWMSIIGEDYIAKAFQFAHEADPAAELYYNDFSIENAPKRKGTVDLVRRLKSLGIPVTGIGMQGHYHMDWPTPEQVDTTIGEFARLGVKVMVTEFDIDMLPSADRSTDAEVTRKAGYAESLNPYRNGLPPEKEQELADRYASLFRVFLKHSGELTRITFWGVRDGDSWLNDWPVPGRTSYPLLFDRNGNPKRAFDAVIRLVQ